MQTPVLKDNLSDTCAVAIANWYVNALIVFINKCTVCTIVYVGLRGYTRPYYCLMCQCHFSVCKCTFSNINYNYSNETNIVNTIQYCTWSI